MDNEMLKNLIKNRDNSSNYDNNDSQNTVIVNNTTNNINVESQEDESIIIEKIRKAVTDKFGQALITGKDDIQFQANVRQFINDMVVLELPYNPIQSSYLIDSIYNDIIGFGPLQPLLSNPDITEIMVSSFDKVFVEKNGVMTLVPEIRFQSKKHLENVIQKIVGPMGRKIDDAEPICDTSLPDGSRVNATLPPATPEGPTLTIRKFSQKKLTTKDYLNFGSLNQKMADFLNFAVSGKANIIVAGGTGTGKTTLLNMISQFVSEKDAIVTIEDTLELKLQQTNVRKMLARKPVNGKGEIKIRDLVKNTLRMRPDRIIVGEIRGGEIYDMLDSMGSGHEGGMGTIHTKSPKHLVDVRIPVLMAMSDIKMEESAQKKMIADAIDLIVYIKRYRDGSRKISNITEVVGYGKEGSTKLNLKQTEDTVYVKDIFTFEEQGYKDGKLQGEYKATGYIPKRIIEKAAIYETYIDNSIFNK